MLIIRRFKEKNCKITLLAGFLSILYLSNLSVVSTQPRCEKLPISSFFGRQAEIRYYYAFDVVLRKEFLTCDNINELFSFYDKEEGIHGERKFETKTDEEKLKEIHGEINNNGDFCTWLDRKRIKRSYVAREDPEREWGLKFEFPDAESTVWYDGRYLIVKICKSEVSLGSALGRDIEPDEFSYIGDEIRRTIYKLFGNELFTLRLLENTNPLDDENLLEQFIQWELVYQDIYVNELIAKDTGEIAARNHECFDCIKAHYENEQILNIESVIMADDPSTNYFRLVFGETAADEWDYFNFYTTGNTEWSEPHCYLNLLEINRIRREMWYYLAEEIDSMTQNRKELQEYRKMKSYEEFFEYYEEKMIPLDSIGVTMQLADAYLAQWQEENSRPHFGFIQTKIGKRIEEMRVLIPPDLDKVQGLKRLYQNESDLLEIQTNNESLINSRLLLGATYVLLAVTVILLGITIIPLIHSFRGRSRRSKRNWPSDSERFFERRLFREGQDEFFREILETIKEKGFNLDSILPEALDAGFSRAAIPVLEDLKKRAPKMLKDRHEFRRKFENRLYELWKEPFDLLEIFLVISHEAGEAFNKEFRPEAEENKDFVFEVLVRLHARACSIAGEILALLRNGYASGAHARWRTLHEIAVIGFFIKQHGNRVAERYLLHDHIESYKAMRKYRDHSDAIGYPPLSEEEFTRAEEIKNELCERFGKPYCTQYGWAAEALENRNPKFSHIENAVNLNHLRPFYQMASHAVHANPKGITFNLGKPEKSKEIILTGPSNTGMADPGHSTAISLHQINAALLTTKISIDSLIILHTMKLLVDEIGIKFLEVHKLTEIMMKE